MNRLNKILSRLSCLALLLGSSVSLQAHGFKALVFTKTAAYAHTSIPAGITAINELAVTHDFEVTQTADAATFISLLPTHQVAVFLNTSGDVLDAAQQTAFQTWYRAGGSYVGIHAACDTEHDWPWYLEMVGGEFSNHPPGTQSGTVKFLDLVHPITNTGSPRTREWTVTEEWYNFVESPRGKSHVLAVLDEKVANPTNTNNEPLDTGTTGGTHGNDHPIMWCQEFDGGRSAYLAPGHNNATYSDPVFRALMVNSIEWAAGVTDGDSGATIESNYEKITLESSLQDPMSMDIAPDGKIYLVERKGAVKVHSEATGITSTIGTLDAYFGGEYGVLGIALAPDFTTSRNLYILWSPTAGENTRLSRFTLDVAGNLDPASEVIILHYLTNRPSNPISGSGGAHQSGCLRFDAAGNLFITTGDDTHPSSFASRNPAYIGTDSRKSSPNTNDLRGKILRITPNVGNGPAGHPNYTIPAGNLFPTGTALAREEIYVMGCRNPFRMCVDPVTGWVYFGDVGPDVSQGGSGGPSGHDEFNQAKTAGWFGWPYYIGDSKPNFASSNTPWTIPTIQQDLTDYFNLPVFTSSGVLAGAPTLLAAPVPAWIWYPEGVKDANGNQTVTTAPGFTEMNDNDNGDTGRCAIAGAVYQFAPGNNFPAYHDRSVFLMEWSRNMILDVKTRDDGSILEISRFAPHLTFRRPIEMLFGPDGSMYVIEWGTAFGGSASSGSALIKVRYTQAQSTPVAVATADVTNGGTPLTVQFSSAGSHDPDSANITFAWDFDGDQITDSTDPNPQHTFTTSGTYQTQLTVTDDDLLFSRASVTISVGNHAPVVTFTQPLDYSFFDWGDTVDFAFNVTDTEDGSSSGGQITDADVLFEASLGHGDHQHNEAQENLLSGTLFIPRDDGHPFDTDLGYVLDAYYTDAGAPGVDPAQGTAKAVLQPKVTMAQTYDDQSGVGTTTTLDPVGGEADVAGIDHGDSISFKGINLASIHTIRFRATNSSATCQIEIRQDSASGNLIGTANVTNTSGHYRDFDAPLSGVLTGSHDLHFVFLRTSGATDLMKLNWINFRGQGATHTPELPVVTGLSVPGTDQVQIDFDQRMDFATLANPANYAINQGATVSAATPLPDQTGVILDLAAVTIGSYYTISLNSLEDIAGDQIASGSTVTHYHREPFQYDFVTGLNCGGPDYTDTLGNLYQADSSSVVTPVTLLGDIFRGSGGETPVASTAADFAAADANVGLNAVPNLIGSNNPSNQALTGIGLTGATFSHTGGNAVHNTNKGNFNNLPIVDGYVFKDTPTGATATIAGLGDIAAGSPVTLTLWGVGDTADSEAQFTVTYNGASLGTKKAEYDTTPPGDTTQAHVTFIFDKVAGQDSISIAWGMGGTTTAGFNGFSLTSPLGVTTGTYFSDGTRTDTRNNAIANTDDDTLYQTARLHVTADFFYKLPLSSGTYQVVLKFAETYFNAANSRIFNVNVEGGSPLFTPNLDVFVRAGGKNIAFDHPINNVAVTDGVLNVGLLRGTANNAQITGIGVFKQVSTSSGIPNPSFQHYLTQNPDSHFDPISDHDADSLNALLEYALGGSDATQDTDLLPTLSPDGGGDLQLSFSRPEGLPDIAYTVVASENLETWVEVSPQSVTSSPVGGLEQVEMRGLKAAAITAGLSAVNSLYFKLQVNLLNFQP